ncbi:uncharacterized protein LOC130950242 [Arachis stenosperma]|uniref:uncharacterized protein LOC130950242 n=1 Tax=Arachis stenosperma TaxID=217475 RepID=UPI0025AD2C1A|nr:uncharacterized protein LOC130950242 [Arachis stenosperma]
MDPVRDTAGANSQARSPLENLDPHGISAFLSQLSAIHAHVSRNSGGFNQDPSNHFFLHPSENSGIAITNVIFNRKNYGDWSRSMVRTLRSKNKIKFIDGSLPRPEIHDPSYEAWERCNTYVVAWLNLSLNSDIAQSVSWKNVALDLWDELKHRYYQGDKFRVAKLQEDLYALKQEDMNVTAYFTELKKMWEELDNFRTIPSCSCGRDCNCGLAVVRNFRTEDQITRFLRGLNEQYAGVRSQVMLMDPLPTQSATLLNTAEDSHSRGRGRGRGGRNQGFGRGQGGRGKMWCSHCGKSGHTIDTCYKKHGYPPHMQQRHNTAIMNISASDSEGRNENLRFSYNGESSGSQIFDFTPEQKSALLALLNKEDQKPNHSAQPHTLEPLPTPHPGSLVHVMHFRSSILALNVSNKKYAPWVVDTGTIDHVSYSLNDFQSYHEIAPILVKLPNGALAISKIAGTIFFSKNLYLVDALYIPSFNFKLISVSKATSHLHCHMNFDDKLCKIQDISSEKVIGAAKACEGLYALNAEAVRPEFFGSQVKVIRTDNGPEFLMPQFYTENEILHQTSCVETPQQNGIVERKHQHLLAVTRSLIFQSDIPKCFWNFALLHAVYIINRIPSTFLQNKSPFQLLYQTFPDLSDLKIFGCLAYACTITAGRHKLDPRARKSIFLGFREGVKGFVLMDLKTRQIFISRNMHFYEDHFPFHTQTTSNTFSQNSASVGYNSHHDPLSYDLFPHAVPHTQSTPSHTTHNENLNSQINSSHTDESAEAASTSSLHHDPKPVVQRRSTRIRSRPSYLQDYQCLNITFNLGHSTQSQCKYPLSNFLSYDKFSPSHRAFSIALSTNTEPKHYEEVVSQPCWKKAIQSELDSLNESKTWKLTTLPVGKKAIGCRWVFKVKYNPDGSIERHKARLVAIPGIYYRDTFSPVLKLTSLRIVLALAAANN